jgi:membrane protein required for colicin V production
LSPSTVDLFLGIALAFFAIKGFLTGFVKTIVSLAAVIIAWFLANKMPELSAPLIRFAVEPNSPAYPLVTRIITWIGAFVVVQLIGSMLSKSLNESGLSGADKIGGLVLGVATGVLVGCLPLFVINAVPALYNWDQTQSLLHHSTLLRAYQPIASKIVPPHRR